MSALPTNDVPAGTTGESLAPASAALGESAGTVSVSASATTLRGATGAGAAGVAKGLDHDCHFRTDHLMDDLKGRSIRGGAVTLSAQAAKFALKLGETIILARLLSPSDFGLVAMVTAITGMVAMFKDAGLSMATVQRPQITHAQVSTLFWINVALSALLMLIVAALAPLVVWIYGEPRLLGITLAVAGTFIFAGLSVQHSALMKRQMRFTALAAVDLTSMAVSVVVALVMAWYGAGYWALVGLLVTQPIIGFVMVWCLSGWRPGLPRRGCGVRPMLAFGGNLTGFNFINYLARNSDNILIGWYWGAVALGVYTKAYSLLAFPLQQINAPVGAVVVPALSRLSTDSVRYRNAYREVLSALTLVTMPLVAVFFVAADLIIIVALGPSWNDSITVFRLLSLASLVQCVSNTIGWLFVSQGRTRELMVWGVIGSTICIVAFVVGLPFGINAVAASYTVSVFIQLPILLLIVVRRGPIKIGDILEPSYLPLVVALVIAVQAYLLRSFIFLDNQMTILFFLVLMSGLVWLCVFLSASKKNKLILSKLLHRKPTI